VSGSEAKSMADPLIAAIGSVHPDRTVELKLRNAAAGENAAKEIGHALARKRCRLVVYSSEGWSVEPLVVKGYVEECTETKELEVGAARIEVRYSQSDNAPYFPEQATHPKLFAFSPDPNPSWASSFYRSLSYVDGAIFLGGSHNTTYIAGLVALSHRKPVLAVASFGGAAEDIWREVTPEPGLLDRTEIDQMATPAWTPQTADNLVENLLLQQQRARDQRSLSHTTPRQRQAMRHVYIAVPFLILAFASVPFTWDNPGWQKSWLLSLLFVAPLLAGIAGATARTAFEAVGGNFSDAPLHVGRTVGLGAIAGGVAGALFLIAQLVSMSPEIVQATWSKQAGRLVPLAALIGFVGGLTLDAVFRKLTGMNVISDEALKTLMAQQSNK
jgi:hypothetical protein